MTVMQVAPVLIPDSTIWPTMDPAHRGLWRISPLSFELLLPKVLGIPMLWWTTSCMAWLITSRTRWWHITFPKREMEQWSWRLE